VPSRQAFGFVEHTPPATQALHAPSLQTWPVPQIVPSGSFVVVGTHACVPVAQDVSPVWQGSGSSVQGSPALHALHTPPLQTWSVPQVVPFCSGAPGLSMQACVPVAQEKVPVRQGSELVVQTPPATQPTQLPPLQTCSAPQTVPLVFGVAVSTHC
jgi:hypothetical protein